MILDSSFLHYFAMCFSKDTLPYLVRSRITFFHFYQSVRKGYSKSIIPIERIKFFYPQKRGGDFKGIRGRPRKMKRFGVITTIINRFFRNKRERVRLYSRTEFIARSAIYLRCEPRALIDTRFTSVFRFFFFSGVVHFLLLFFRSNRRKKISTILGL